MLKAFCNTGNENISTPCPSIGFSVDRMKPYIQVHLPFQEFPGLLKGEVMKIDMYSFETRQPFTSQVREMMNPAVC